MKPKILIASNSFSSFPVILKKTWEKLNKKYEITKNNYGRDMNQEEIVKKGKGCEGIVAGLEKYGEFVFQNIPTLRCISRDGAGMDNVDLFKAKEYGIVVRNTPTAPTQAVAELTIGLIISLLRKIPMVNQDLHQGKWNKYHGSLFQNKTVGIIGVGNIGKRVTLLLKPFACKIIGNDIKPDLKWFKENNIVHVSKKQLFAKSDIICLHVSLLPRNKHMINEKAIKQMKRGVILLNLSRGQVVDEGALIKYLRNDHIKTAALDVFEQEPYKGPLTKMENVILTPHIGGSTQESRYLMQMGALENLIEELGPANK